MRHLQPVAQEQLRSYLPYLMRALGLDNWTVDVRPASSKPGTNGHVDVTPETRYAEMHLTADWSDLTAEEQRDTLVHELLHLQHHPLSTYVTELLDEHKSQAMREVIRVETEWLGSRFTTLGVVDSAP